MRWLNNLPLWQRQGIELGLVFGLTSVVASWVQAIPTLADPDSYYHARFTVLMLQHGIIQTFPWLPLTTLGQAFADHHLLYHISLMPAIWLLGPLVGLKVTQALSIVLLVAVLYFILKRRQVPYAGVAILLLFSSYPMLVRMNLAKASVGAVLLFVLIIVAVTERRYRWAAALTLVYTLTHGGFFLAGLIAVVAWVADCIVQVVKEKTFRWPLPTGIMVVSVAMLLGVVSSPYFPSNLGFFWAQFVQIGVVNYHSVIQVGAEWYPFPFQNLIAAISILLIGLMGVIGLTIVEWRQLLRDRTIVTLYLLLPLFFTLTLRSRRFIEYFVPVLWLLVCFVALPSIRQGRLRQWWQQLRQRMPRVMRWVEIYLWLGISFAVLSVYPNLDLEFRSQDYIDRYAAAGAYLAARTDQHTVVFHGQWDDFPQLFYYNPQAAYIVGLDATFLYLADQTLYQHWHDISSGLRKQATAGDIRRYFGSRYVVVNETTEDTKLMYAYLLRDPSVRKVFSVEQISIFDLDPQ